MNNAAVLEDLRALASRLCTLSKDAEAIELDGLIEILEPRLLDWKPIESAPWDRAVLTFTATAVIGEILVAHRNSPPGSGRWRLTGSALELTGPTHWMELPEEPK